MLISQRGFNDFSFVYNQFLRELYNYACLTVLFVYTVLFVWKHNTVCVTWYINYVAYCYVTTDIFNTFWNN